MAVVIVEVLLFSVVDDHFVNFFVHPVAVIVNDDLVVDIAMVILDKDLLLVVPMAVAAEAATDHEDQKTNSNCGD